MNVHYLKERVMGGDTGRPLRWDDVIASPVPLKVVATSLDTLTTVILDDFKDVDDLKKVFIGEVARPRARRDAPVTHRGHRLVDAAVLEPGSPCTRPSWTIARTSWSCSRRRTRWTRRFCGDERSKKIVDFWAAFAT